ncbi:metallophosphoesterase [Clostridium sporogenes]|uniref:metallophosphoesterase n=1 Tax=Clostridium sporogenes TaxID=1509 RepID=UPI0028FEB62E|nr:metallophosphoesterase [Clostridium botulinum]
MKNLRKFVLKSICLITCLFIVVGVYSTFIEPKLLIIKKFTVESNISIKTDKRENLRIAHITDTHLGEFFSLEQLQKVVNKINENNVDIVLFTGDLMDNASKYNHIGEISKVLSKIQANKGKYAVYGNRDYGGGAVRYYKSIMKKSGFNVLVNESKTINIGSGKKISFLGIDDILMGNPDAQKLMKNINKNNYNILLMHEPDYINNLLDCDIDLTLTGHSHGGQVYIPFYGGVGKTLYAKKYERGMYDLKNIRQGKLYVNTGIGNTKIPMRFCNIPNISIFNIKI